MSGTKRGGRKASQTIYNKYGRDFYVSIGQKGGKNSNNGGFASKIVGKDGLTGQERARAAGAKGGARSKRKKK